MSGRSPRPAPGEGTVPSPSRRRRTGTRLLLAAVLAGAGCTAPPPDPAPRAARTELDLETVASPMEAALRRGLLAAKLGDYPEARAQLGAVAANCPGVPLGSRALLTLVTVDLDPRNPERNPARARRLLEEHFAIPRKPGWTEPVMETLYLLAAELSLVADTVAAIADTAAAADTVAAADTAAAGRDSVRTGDARDAVTGDSISGPGGASAADSSPPLRVPEARPDSAASGEAAPRDSATGRQARVADRVLLADQAAFPCRSTGPEPVAGIRRPPEVEGSPLLARLVELLDERAGLRQSNAELARQLAELRQELERIRATLSP